MLFKCQFHGLDRGHAVVYLLRVDPSAGHVGHSTIRPTRLGHTPCWYQTVWMMQCDVRFCLPQLVCVSDVLTEVVIPSQELVAQLSGCVHFWRLQLYLPSDMRIIRNVAVVCYIVLLFMPLLLFEQCQGHSVFRPCVHASMIMYWNLLTQYFIL